MRLNDEERAKLETIAVMWGLSLSAAMRRLIREKRCVTTKRADAREGHRFIHTATAVGFLGENL